jgi:hypothetical protein
VFDGAINHIESRPFVAPLRGPQHFHFYLRDSSRPNQRFSLSLKLTAMVTEDEIYRSSTQFRLWNFTSDRLAALRRKTNRLAKEHVRKAIKRRRELGHSTPQASDREENGSRGENGTTDAGQNGHGKEARDAEIDFLTVQEERILVDYYCAQLLNMVQSETAQFPTQVVVSTCASFLFPLQY